MSREVKILAIIWALIGVALVLLFIACGPTGPVDTWRGGTEYSQPWAYGPWMVELAECAGVEIPEIQWYAAPGWFVLSPQGDTLFGTSSPIARKVVLAERWTMHEGAVKHEALHVAGFLGHPSPPFGECAPRWIMRPEEETGG